MTYHDALTWLYTFADLERGVGLHSGAPPSMGLPRVRRLLHSLGDPHHGPLFVHVAGSKGKGSVCAMVAAAAEAAGLRTGLFTQPHLYTFRERMQINGEPITPEVFDDRAARVRPLVAEVNEAKPDEGTLTTFEIATAMALDWFAGEAVDLAVIEVGLGGRLDATNVIAPAVTAVTQIVLEHTRLLGSTLEAIAAEKAGIFKAGVPALVARQSAQVERTLNEAAGRVGAPLRVVDPLPYRGQTVWRDGRPIMLATSTGTDDALPLGLIGHHQLGNAALSLAILETLAAKRVAIPRNARRAGLAAPQWPGRLEAVAAAPTVIVDAAHTPESVALAVRSMRELLALPRGPVIFGALRDKRVPAMLDALQPFATSLILLEPDHPRGWSTARLRQRYPDRSDLRAALSAADAPDALRRARSACQKGEGVLALGSLAVAAQVRAAAGRPGTPDPRIDPAT